MGYESQVGLVIRGKELSDKIIATNIARDYAEIIKTKVVDGEVFTLIHWGWIKWYEENNDVKCIMMILEGGVLDSEVVNDNDFLFVRLGEEDGDIETRGDMWGNPFSFGYKREITFRVDDEGGE